jgi:hypothetical protein
MALAARHRADRAMTFATLGTANAGWQCGRGHAWDDGVSAAQNVRCMRTAHRNDASSTPSGSGPLLRSGAGDCYPRAMLMRPRRCDGNARLDTAGTRKRRLPRDNGLQSACVGVCTTHRHRIARKAIVRDGR